MKASPAVFTECLAYGSSRFYPGPPKDWHAELEKAPRETPCGQVQTINGNQKKLGRTRNLESHELELLFIFQRL